MTLTVQFHLKTFVFQLNDQGHYAEALMTKGVLAPRGCMEQLKVYNIEHTILHIKGSIFLKNRHFFKV